MRVKTRLGLERFEVSIFFQDFLEFLEITELLEIASNLLKIGQKVAHGQVVIATRTFCECQNSHGLRAPGCVLGISCP